MTAAAARAAGMRPILVIDCSGPACSAALAVGGEVVASRFERLERGHASLLLPQIQAILLEAGIKPAELGAIATTVGPGSFTGLRIGLAAARGLALVTGASIIGLTTFDAHRAQRHPHATPLVVAVDSKRGALFLQRFTPVAHAPESVQTEALDAWIPAGSWTAIGDAAGCLQRPGWTVERTEIDAAAIGRALGQSDFHYAAHAAQPLYMRPPDVTLPVAALVS